LIENETLARLPGGGHDTDVDDVSGGVVVNADTDVDRGTRDQHIRVGHVCPCRIRDAGVISTKNAERPSDVITIGVAWVRKHVQDRAGGKVAEAAKCGEVVAAVGASEDTGAAGDQEVSIARRHGADLLVGDVVGQHTPRRRWREGINAVQGTGRVPSWSSQSIETAGRESPDTRQDDVWIRGVHVQRANRKRGERVGHGRPGRVGGRSVHRAPHSAVDSPGEQDIGVGRMGRQGMNRADDRVGGDARGLAVCDDARPLLHEGRRAHQIDGKQQAALERFQEKTLSFRKSLSTYSL
jgi:hypothetical protein